VKLSQFIEKNKSWYRPGKHFYEAHYKIKVVVGPADMKFELWFDGQNYTTDNSIKVVWESGANASSRENQDLDTDMLYTREFRHHK
jgi:hypothetical protein